MKKEYTFFDFIMDISNCIFNPKKQSETPYDVNFANHYKTLYEIEETMKNDMKTKLDIKDIIQDKKTKNILINTDINIDKDKKESLENLFNENNISYTINKGKLKNISINKNSKGVIEERKWKEDSI